MTYISIGDYTTNPLLVKQAFLPYSSKAGCFRLGVSWSWTIWWLCIISSVQKYLPFQLGDMASYSFTSCTSPLCYSIAFKGFLSVPQLPFPVWEGSYRLCVCSWSEPGEKLHSYFLLHSNQCESWAFPYFRTNTPELVVQPNDTQSYR